MILVTLSFPEAKVKIQQKVQISLCKKLNNKYFNYYVKVQVKRFYLNNSTLGFYPRIQKLQPLYETALFTLGIKELGSRSFDFWGGYGWFQEKKYPADWFRGKKNSCKEIPGEKNSYAEIKSVMAYNAGKYLTPLYFGKKILSPEVKRGKKF